MVTCARRLRLGGLVFVLLTFGPIPARSQTQNFLAPASQEWLPPVSSADSAAQRSSNPTVTDPSDLEVSWRKLPMRFVRDQKAMWLFPVKLAEGHHWLPTAIVVGGTAVFIKEDPPLMRKARQTDIFHGYNRAFSSTVSGGLTAVIPLGFYAVSLVRKDSYGQATGLLTGEAVVDDTVLMIALKAITRRARPSEFPPNAAYNDTFFATHNSLLGKGSSFPSGHAMMSFSVATVFARRYRQHKWVPYVAYALATAFSFSRVTTGAHFPSDVFFGAATGFAIAQYAVLRHE